MRWEKNSGTSRAIICTAKPPIKKPKTPSLGMCRAWMMEMMVEAQNFPGANGAAAQADSCVVDEGGGAVEGDGVDQRGV